MVRSVFVVRKRYDDPKSETIATESSANRAYQEAMTFLMESGRDYEAFELAEVDTKTKRSVYVECVSWEPRG